MRGPAQLPSSQRKKSGKKKKLAGLSSSLAGGKGMTCQSALHVPMEKPGIQSSEATVGISWTTLQATQTGLFSSSISLIEKRKIPKDDPAGAKKLPGISWITHGGSTLTKNTRKTKGKRGVTIGKENTDQEGPRGAKKTTASGVVSSSKSEKEGLVYIACGRQKGGGLQTRHQPAPYTVKRTWVQNLTKKRTQPTTVRITRKKKD